jgi:plastocyanin
MKRFFFVAAVAAGLLSTASGTAAERLMTITATGFVPRNATVDVGDVVTWRNADTRAHQVVVARTCNITVQPGATGSCTFRNAGRFSYREPAFRGTAWRGTITVRALAGSLTIAARPTTVTYGGAATLTGAVSSAQASERVGVTAGACGSTALANVATVSTAAGGTWTLAVRPLQRTVYQARWRNVSSAQATVNVRPRVTVRKLTRSRFLVRVAAAQSFGGKVVSLQRYVPSARRWVRVRFVVLRTISAGNPTIVSGATARAGVRAGTRVRAVLGQGQVGACYVASISNTVRG